MGLLPSIEAQSSTGPLFIKVVNLTAFFKANDAVFSLFFSLQLRAFFSIIAALCLVRAHAVKTAP